MNFRYIQTSLQAMFKKFLHRNPHEVIELRKPRVLFILKQREAPYEGEGQYSSGTLHSGLFNSASFVNGMLKQAEYTSHIVHVDDNNRIDHEVTRFRPDVVIIEAFWVVPEKFEALTKLHPNVKWVIRNHSKTPFLANEGIAYDWAMRYSKIENVFLSSNSLETNSEMESLIRARDGRGIIVNCPYLPNYYPKNQFRHRGVVDPRSVVDIGCFGAIRPLKNHMIQAVAAIKFAERNRKTLRFHINGNRVEGAGDNVLKNLRNLFKHLPHHSLVEHTWVPHHEFLKSCAAMDLGLQVSYTETFNIVAADLVSQGVPVITSDQIEWNDERFYADPNCSDDIVRVMEDAYSQITNRHSNTVLRSTINNLDESNRKALLTWKEALHELMA